MNDDDIKIPEEEDLDADLPLDDDLDAKKKPLAEDEEVESIDELADEELEEEEPFDDVNLI
ncbi:MAG: hypothetical protein NUV78_02475 [Candidatus Zambryskibacteria bacterium]|nr:hypothetical protein [Candidatus Zambryskibacteria bacterium]